jgi:hypothetical protein
METPASCRTTGGGISDLTAKITNCTTPEEQTRNLSLATVLHLTDEIGDLKSAIQNSMVMGDNIFGTAGHEQITREVKHRNDELKLKKATLTKEIEKKHQVVHMNDRDFSDHLDGTISESKLITIEDYTVFVFLLTYVFLLCVAIYTYTITNPNQIEAFGKAFLAATILTIIGGMLFYSVV